jgi:hypothetical protein
MRIRSTLAVLSATTLLLGSGAALGQAQGGGPGGQGAEGAAATGGGRGAGDCPGMQGGGMGGGHMMGGGMGGGHMMGAGRGGRGGGGMMGGEGMGGPMGAGAGHAMPQLPPGNEKLQMQMQAEMMQKMGEILAKYAAQVKE